MSEFSDSVHFVEDNPTVVETLLRQLGIACAVLGTNGKIVSTLIPWENRDKAIASGKVVEYTYGEDHGLWIYFYVEGHLTAKIVYLWGEDFETEESGENGKPGVTENLEEVLTRYGFLSEKAATDLAAFLQTFNPEDWENLDASIARLGELLGLYAFNWLSSQDLIYNREILEDRFPKMVFIE